MNIGGKQVLGCEEWSWKQEETAQLPHFSISGNKSRPIRISLAVRIVSSIRAAEGLERIRVLSAKDRLVEFDGR